MPAPTLQAQGTANAVTTGNLSITLPTYAADDIVVITTVGWVPNTTTGTATQSLASPWTKYSPDITTITSSLIDAEYACWWARATSASSLGSSVSITRPANWDTGTDTCWGGRAYVIRGCVTTGDPFDQFTASAITTSANPDLPAVTVSAGNRLVVAFMVKADNTATPTAATGYTVGTEALDTSGTDCGFQSYRRTASSNVAAVTPSGGTGPAQGGQVYFAFSFDPPVFARTVSDSGTGTESATPNVIPAITTHQRTASDSAAGTESATRKLVARRTATDSGAGTETATGKIPKRRTATDTATGSETTATKVTQFRLGALTDFSFGFTNGGGQFYVGSIPVKRTASDSSVGTQSANWSIKRARTVSDSATSTETSLRTIVRFRSASDNATSSEISAYAVIQLRLGVYTDFTFGFTNGGGRFYIGASTVKRTASDSATGTESTTKTLVAKRTASDSATGTETVFGIVKHFRTVTDFGTATESSTKVVVRQRTAFDSTIGTESITSRVIAVYRRTVSDSATGTETVTGRISRERTINDSASGTESATRLIKRFRTVTDTAAGTESTTSNLTRARIATGPATSSETVTRIVVVLRTVTDSANSTETAVRVLVAKRTVTDSATGTQTATGCKLFRKTVTDNASSDQFAEWMKSHILRLPATDEYPGGLFGYPGTDHRLRSYDRSGRRAQNLYKLTDGTFTTVEQRDQGQVEKVYLGSHQIFLTDPEVAELTAAGYGSYIT